MVGFPRPTPTVIDLEHGSLDIEGLLHEKRIKRISCELLGSPRSQERCDLIETPYYDDPIGLVVNLLFLQIIWVVPAGYVYLRR